MAKKLIKVKLKKLSNTINILFLSHLPFASTPPTWWLNGYPLEFNSYSFWSQWKRRSITSGNRFDTTVTRSTATVSHSTATVSRSFKEYLLNFCVLYYFILLILYYFNIINLILLIYLVRLFNRKAFQFVSILNLKSREKYSYY